MTAEEVLGQAAKVYLNDQSQVLWTNTVLLPCLTKANEDLERELEVYEISLQKDTSLTVSVEIGDTQLDELPVDFIEPISLFERSLGSSDHWKLVDQAKGNFVDPNITTSAEIIQWSYRDNAIQINPPVSDRDVFLRYVRSITPLITTGSTVEIPQSKGYLSARTAQLAAANLGNSPEKANALQPEVTLGLDRVLRIFLNSEQGVSGTRRRRWRGKRITLI